MRTVALCWELGAGFGHLTTLLPVARALLSRGDRVFLIARNLWSAAQVFCSDGVTFLQAPLRHGEGLQYDPTPTFSYILHNIGFSEPAGLAGLAAGWRNLFELIRPDLILADHSPTALLAARGLDIPAVVWGTGFYCPPDGSPLPALLPMSADGAEQARAVEAEMLANANQVLAGWNARPLARLADLYHDGPRRFLLTFPGLDHYPDRRGDARRGYWPYGPGAAPDWPAGDGPKVFAYLKHYPGLPAILDALTRLKAPTLAYIDGADPALRKRFEGPTLRFAPGMLDLRAVVAEAALGITNANIGTMTALLLGGVPLLSIPLQLEQLLVGKAVERMGAGPVLSPTADPFKAISQALSDPRPREAARAFAERHRDFDPERQMAELLAECDAAIGERA